MKKRLLKRSDVLREGYVKGLRKAQGVISRMLRENAGVTFNEWFDEWVSEESAALVGDGDPKVGKCVYRELWSQREVVDSGRSQEFVDWVLNEVDFYPTERLPEEIGVRLEDEYAPTEDEWEDIEYEFSKRQKTALEVQYTDSDNCYGYGVAVFSGMF